MKVDSSLLFIFRQSLAVNFIVQNFSKIITFIRHESYFDVYFMIRYQLFERTKNKRGIFR